MESGKPRNTVRAKPAVPPKPSNRGARPASAQKGPATNPKPTAFPAPTVSKSSTPKHAGDGLASLPAAPLLSDGSVEHAVGAAGQDESANQDGVSSVPRRHSSNSTAEGTSESNAANTGRDTDDNSNMASVMNSRPVGLSLGAPAQQNIDQQLDEMEKNNNNIKTDASNAPMTQGLISSCDTDASAIVSIAAASESSDHADASSLLISEKSNAKEKIKNTRCTESAAAKASVGIEEQPRPVPKMRQSVGKSEKITESNKSEVNNGGSKNHSDNGIEEDLEQRTLESLVSEICPAHGNLDKLNEPLRPPRRPKHMRKSYLKCRSTSHLNESTGDQVNSNQSTEVITNVDSVAESNTAALISPPRNSSEAPVIPIPARSMKNSKSDSQVNRLAANISGVVDLRLKEQLTSGRPKPPIKPKPDKVSGMSPTQNKSGLALESCEQPVNNDASQSSQDSEDVESTDVVMPMPLKGVRVLPTKRVTKSDSNLNKPLNSDYGHVWLASEGSNMSLASQSSDVMSQSMVDPETKTGSAEVRCQSMVFETDAQALQPPKFLRTQSEQGINIPPRVPSRKAPAPPQKANQSKKNAPSRPNVPPPHNTPPLLVPLSKKGDEIPDTPPKISSHRHMNDDEMETNQLRDSIYDPEGYLRPHGPEFSDADDVYSYAQLPGQIASPDAEAISPPPPIHPRPAKRPRSLSASPALCQLREVKAETESTGSDNSRDSQGSDKRSSIMGHFYELIRSKSMRSKKKSDEPNTKSVFYCEANEVPNGLESQTIAENKSETAESSSDCSNNVAPPLPVRNSKPNSDVPVPFERTTSVNGPGVMVKQNSQTTLKDISESAAFPGRETGILPQQVIDESLLDTPIVAPNDDDYDDAAALGVEPYAATDIINNPAIDAIRMDDVSLDVEIPIPTAAARSKKRKVNHGYVGEASSSGDEEHPYDDAMGGADAVRNSYSTHTYEATSDLDSDADSEADSDGYIYPDAQNLPHTAANVAAAAGRTAAPSIPAPPTPRHRDVPAPPPLPRRSTSIQSPQPPLPERSASLQTTEPNPELKLEINAELNVITNTDNRSTMGHVYSEAKDPNSDSSDPDSDIYDDTYGYSFNEADSLNQSDIETSPEYQVYDASCSESKELVTAEVSQQATDSPAIAIKEDTNDDQTPEGAESADQQASISVNLGATGGRPESWTSSGSDHLTIASGMKPSRWSGSSFVSGSSCAPSMSDHSDAEFEKNDQDLDDSVIGPRNVSTLRKDEPQEIQAKRKAKAFHIVKEIMTTEESFINDLNILKEFRDTILQSFQHRPELIQQEVKQMFKYLLELQRVNEDLLKDISDRVQTWETKPVIADIFVKKGPFLKLYTAYIREFESSTFAFEEARKKYPDFDKFTIQFEESHCKKLALKHFMLKPIQRIPQYRLLLLDYLNQLIEDAEEYTQTKAALAILNEVAEHANESAKYRDNVKKLQDIQSCLIGNFEVIKPGRSFIKEGILQKLSRKVMQPRMFYLFNDILLITSHSATGYKVKNVIPLTDLKVSLPTKEDFQNEFSMISTLRSFTVAASTPEERDEWLNAIDDATLYDSFKRNTFTSRKSYAPNMTLSVNEILKDVDEMDSKLGRGAPVWVPDARVSMCMLCTAEFTIAFRRHHCRGCGKIVCSHCSNYRAPLKYLEHKAARVCSICFLTLKNEAKDGPPLPEDVKSRFKSPPSNSQRSKVKRPAVLHEVKANDEDAEMSGYLKVWRGNKWKKKWFVLKKNALFTFKASEDAAAAESLVLLGYEIRTFGTPKEVEHVWFEGIEPRLVFEIGHTGTTKITFRTESESSRDKWIAALREATLP